MYYATHGAARLQRAGNVPAKGSLILYKGNPTLSNDKIKQPRNTKYFIFFTISGYGDDVR